MISKLYLHIDLVFIYVVMCMLERTNILINKAFTFAYVSRHDKTRLVEFYVIVRKTALNETTDFAR